ncbi:MAG: UbiA family prenyltransferase [Candidatus Hodarchaeales archaeon]
MHSPNKEKKSVETSKSIITDVSLFTKFFRARLNIGYVAVPYVILGFLLHWSIQGFEFQFITEGAWWRFIFASIIAFTYMPYVFVINDYFDAPFDALDEKKRLRNPFCSDDVKIRKNLKFYLGLPAIISLILGFLISWQAGIITIFALFLGNFYSAKPLRFKEKPFFDFFVHGFCLGIYFFSLGYYSIWVENYEPFLEPIFVLLLIFTFVDASWIHIDSAIKDLTTDKKSNQNTTVVFLGPNYSILLLKLMLLILLSAPAFFILINNHLITKYGIEIAIIVFSILLILPLIYIVNTRGGSEKLEKIRIISSRYRVYSVYLAGLFFIFFSNPNMFL